MLEMNIDRVAENFHRDGFSIIPDFMNEAEMKVVEAELNTLMTARCDAAESADFSLRKMARLFGRSSG